MGKARARIYRTDEEQKQAKFVNYYGWCETRLSRTHRLLGCASSLTPSPPYASCPPYEASAGDKSGGSY